MIIYNNSYKKMYRKSRRKSIDIFSTSKHAMFIWYIMMIAMVQFVLIIVMNFKDKGTLEKILYFHLYFNLIMFMLGTMKYGKRIKNKCLRRYMYFGPYLFCCF